jgi:predicted HTH transcriptional regulator
MELTLTQLIKLGENQQQDFKHTIEDQKKIARTLVAFANTEGGRLLIGVKDNGKVAGVNPEEEYHMIEGAAKLFCKPEIKFDN